MSESEFTELKNFQNGFLAGFGFYSASLTAEFHTAVGQFINLWQALEKEELDYTLYLAVPVEIYNSYFQRELPQAVIQQYQFKLVIYDIDTMEIVKWIN